MAGRSSRRKFALFLCSTILLGVQCSPLVVDSIKGGVVGWVSGSFTSFNLNPFTDFIINTFTGGQTQFS